MRQGTNPRRSRGRGGRKVHNPRSHMYDSNGPSVRIRGSALQIYEKYSLLARDSQRTDRIAAENLAQHAEHYFRLANANNALANNNAANNGAGGHQGRPNGAGNDGDADERFPPANEGDTRQSEEADGQHGRQQRQDQRRDRQQHQADAPQEPQAETPAAEVTVALPPPSPADEPASVDNPAPSAQAENPPRRRRTVRPRKTAPEASSDGDTEPVEA